NDLLNVFTYYLDDIDEVKSGLIEHLAEFIECLPQSTRNNYLPSLNDVWDGVKNHWRLRDEITKQIPELCRLVDGQCVISHILPLTIRAIKDEVASVRETAVASFPVLFEVVRNDESCLRDMINC
ncbi:35688_t:CDS:2, partial [Racocetra persica]